MPSSQLPEVDLEVMVKCVAEIFNEFELYKIEFNKKPLEVPCFFGDLIKVGIFPRKNSSVTHHMRWQRLVQMRRKLKLPIGLTTSTGMIRSCQVLMAGAPSRSSSAVFHPLPYNAAKVLKQKRFIHEVVHARLQACVAI